MHTLTVKELETAMASSGASTFLPQWSKGEWQGMQNMYVIKVSVAKQSFQYKIVCQKLELYGLETIPKRTPHNKNVLLTRSLVMHTFRRPPEMRRREKQYS
jgi:hypothetical protein